MVLSDSDATVCKPINACNTADVTHHYRDEASGAEVAALSPLRRDDLPCAVSTEL